MRIERAVLREVSLELKKPFRTSHGPVRRRRVLLLTLQGEGLEGWSECVAGVDPSYTAETVDTAWHVLTDFVLPRVVGHSVHRPEEVLRPVEWVRGHPMALAALEMAAWDLDARCAGVSLAAKLGGERTEVPVGISLGLSTSRAELLEAVGSALDEGYERVKLKIERGREHDILSAVRDRFPKATLWADANGAYTLADTGRLRALDALALGLLEQPLAHDDFLDHARLQKELETPVCLDESIRSARDTALALELGSCRVVNLKPGRVGGHAESRRIHDLLRGSGTPLWCGGMLETGIGRAHNLALASLPGFSLPGDISASGRYWERDIVSPEHEVRSGTMCVPAGPGIGVAVDLERIEALTSRSAAYP